MNAREPKERGAILLTTLLVMSLMSALAVAMMDDIRVAILRSGNIQAHAQSDWHLKAAEDFAKSYIEARFITLSEEEQNIALQRPLTEVFPIDGAVLVLNMWDGTQCLALSSLKADSDGNKSVQAQAFERLLVKIGLPEIEAETYTAAIIDWQDEDQRPLSGGAEDYTYLGLDPAYRTSDTVLNSVSELRSVYGIREELIEELRPYVCAGDTERSGAININTINAFHIPVLSVFLGEDQDNLAAEILQRRPVEGYTSLVEDLTNAGIEGAERVDSSLFVYRPEYLWVEIDVERESARRTVLLEFKIDSEQLTRTYRHYGTEGRRPVLEDAEEEESSTR